MQRRGFVLYVNGKEIVIKDGTPLIDFLADKKYDRAKIAIERNKEIVPKKEYENVILKNTDKLEIVSFVGGG